MTTDRGDQLADNVGRVMDRVADAARRAGREPEDISLVAVTKTVAAPLVAAAFRLGLTVFGENRVQEAADKLPRVRALLGDANLPQWHLIGHLQTNKVRQALGLFDLVQSVDSLRLAEHLSAQASLADRQVPFLLEVNIAREPQKHGFLVEDLPAAVEAIASLPNLLPQGLMSMAPLVSDPEEVRPVFRMLRELRDGLQAAVAGNAWHHLSMGMSDDYGVAIEEGATIIRLGRAIFGDRQA